MRNYDYGIASPSEKRMKTSISLRPKSQPHKFSTAQQRNPSVLAPQPLEQQGRKSFQLPPTPPPSSSEYYHQTNTKSGHSFRSPDRHYSSGDVSIQKMEKWKRGILMKIEKGINELREQIFKQSSQIMHLEKVVHKQERELDGKNCIIQSLISKLQKNIGTISANRTQMDKNIDQPYIFKKMGDLEAKVKILTNQFQQQQTHINSKLDNLAINTIRSYGHEIKKYKNILYLFIDSKDKELMLMEANLQKMAENSQLQPFTKTSSKTLKNSIEGICSVRDTCSSVNSKDSLPLDKPQRRRKDQSMFSDYFFHPSPSITINQPESPAITSILQLVKDREELPIRVFTDQEGRLKYWQSRTFLFDRKGNFTTPNQSELNHMQQKGWLKLISS